MCISVTESDSVDKPLPVLINDYNYCNLSSCRFNRALLKSLWEARWSSGEKSNIKYVGVKQQEHNHKCYYCVKATFAKSKALDNFYYQRTLIKMEIIIFYKNSSWQKLWNIAFWELSKSEHKSKHISIYQYGQNLNIGLTSKTLASSGADGRHSIQ